MSDPVQTRQRPLILYVDDERANRVVFEASMQAEFAILTAQDGDTALELLARDDIAVLVTDMRMPTMNGEQLLRIAKERYPRVIRMVITAYADIDPILRAINEGLVARYILKPWVRAELVQVLRWAIEAWLFSRDSDELNRRLLETERLATLGSISSMLVHDLRQPLMSLLMNLDHIRELAVLAPELHTAIVESELPPDTRTRLAEIVGDLPPLTTDLITSAQHLNQMIQNLREFSKPRGPSELPSTDPLPILRHAMGVCQELVVGVGASIDYRGPSELPRVRMAPTELTQVLINLLANSAQAVGRRGAPHGTVSIDATQDAGMLELRIRDDGVGMAPDVLARIGTPFFTTRAEGTGLGLAQCQRLVGTAGGRLQIESAPGVGTTVIVTLPTAA